MRSYFKANGLWTDLKRQFSIPNAGKAIHESTGEALTKFRETVAAFLQEHRWYCMAELPEPKRVVNVLKSVVVTLLNAPDAKQAEKDEALTVSRSRWRSTGPGATSTGHSASRTWPLWRTQARRRPTGPLSRSGRPTPHRPPRPWAASAAPFATSGESGLPGPPESPGSAATAAAEVAIGRPARSPSESRPGKGAGP